MTATANRVVKNTGWLYARMGITMFISLYTTRVILNSLGASDFGIFNIVGGAIGMLGFLNAAMASSTVRFMSFAEGAGDLEKKKKIFNVSCVLHVIIALLIGILLVIIGFVLFNGVLNIPSERLPAARVVYGSLIFSTMLTVINVPYEAIMNSHENMKYYAFIGILESVLKLAIAYVCVYTSFDRLVLYGILMASIPLITLSIMKVYCHKHYDECVISLNKYYSKTTLKEMTSFASWNLFVTAASMITNSGLGIVMNMFFGTVINAAQGVANQICGQLMSINTSLSKAITPVITKSEGANTREKTLLMAETSSKVLFFALSLLAIPALATLPTLMNFWLKNVPDFAVYFASIQLMIYMCEQLVSGFGTAINATGNIKSISILRSLFKFSFLPLSFILFKLNVSVVIVYFLLFIIQGVVNGILATVYYGSKILNYSPLLYLRNVFVPAVFTASITFAVGSLCSLYFKGNNLMFVAFLLCGITNVICFYIFTLNNREKLLAKNMLVSISKHFKR